MTSELFEGFTARARTAVVLAQEHARLAGAAEVDASYVLLGLLHTDRNGTMQDLLGVTTAEISEQLESTGHTRARTSPLEFTASATHAFANARREAADLHHGEIDSRHLLLGVLDTQGRVTKMLTSLHVDAVDARRRVLDWLTYAKPETDRIHYPRRT